MVPGVGVRGGCVEIPSRIFVQGSLDAVSRRGLLPIFPEILLYHFPTSRLGAPKAARESSGQRSGSASPGGKRPGQWSPRKRRDWARGDGRWCSAGRGGRSASAGTKPGPRDWRARVNGNKWQVYMVSMHSTILLVRIETRAGAWSRGTGPVVGSRKCDPSSRACERPEQLCKVPKERLRPLSRAALVLISIPDLEKRLGGPQGRQQGRHLRRALAQHLLGSLAVRRSACHRVDDLDEREEGLPIQGSDPGDSLVGGCHLTGGARRVSLPSLFPEGVGRSVLLELAPRDRLWRWRPGVGPTGVELVESRGRRLRGSRLHLIPRPLSPHLPRGAPDAFSPSPPSPRLWGILLRWRPSLRFFWFRGGRVFFFFGSIKRHLEDDRAVLRHESESESAARKEGSLSRRSRARVSEPPRFVGCPSRESSRLVSASEEGGLGRPLNPRPRSRPGLSASSAR